MDSANMFDLVVIGAGPGGYVCAIKAAQLGAKVAIVEKRATYGGTCLNVGCIPSKALLHISELYNQAVCDFDKMGIVAPKISHDIGQMMKFKNGVIEDNAKGISFLFKKYGVDTFQGHAKIISPSEISISSGDKKVQTVHAQSIVIATGSEVSPLAGVEIDEKRILSSTGALELSEVPRHLVVVGAGVIGLELSSVWSRLGTKVTCIEFLPRILAGMDEEIANNFQRILKKQGFEFRLGHKVTSIKSHDTGLVVNVEAASGGDIIPIEADYALIAIGRRPYTEGLGLEELHIEMTKTGQIVTDNTYATNIKGIYAIGDAIAGPMLAHKAEEDGVIVAEILAGQSGSIHYDRIPSVVYTAPEIASVGKTEEELKEAKIDYKKGKFNFIANGRAKAVGHTEGFVKVLSCAASDRVLGVHIIGANAGELIAEATLLLEFAGSSEDLARTIHAHPTLSEALKEAALDTFSQPLHS